MRSRSQFGEYFLLKPEAQAFFGEIFTAAHKEGPAVDRVVQLHLYNRGGLEPQALSDAMAGRRDVQELLTGPHFATGFDVGTINEVPFVGYDHVVGRSLSQIWVETRRLGETIPLEHVFEIARQASRALAVAGDLTLGGHALVHGFLVPDFLHLSHEGELSIQGFESSFGLRRTSASELDESATRPYLSPETRAGDPAQPADDVFSLSAILFELLTGEAPPESDSYGEIVDQARLMEGGTLPYQALELLKEGLAPESRRIRTAATWLKRLEDAAEGFESTPFSLAFFLFRLFGTELETEHQEHQDAKALRFGAPAPSETSPTPLADRGDLADPVDATDFGEVAAATAPLSTQSEENSSPELPDPIELPIPALPSAALPHGLADHPAKPFVAGFATTLLLALLVIGYSWLSR